MNDLTTLADAFNGQQGSVAHTPDDQLQCPLKSFEKFTPLSLFFPPVLVTEGQAESTLKSP